MCSTCHDPHGVGAADNVPILRGTWLTSPYKEDRPPVGINGLDSYWDWRLQANEVVYHNNNLGGQGPRLSPEFDNNMPANLGFGYAAGDSGTTWGKGGSVDQGGYYIDENTFGTDNGFLHNPTRPANQRMGTWYDNSGGTNKSYKPKIRHFSDNNTAYDTASEFAGLCIACHSTTDLANFAPHKTVPGSPFNTNTGTMAWSNLFNRPYMHMMHRDKSPTPSSTTSECDWGQPAQSDSWHEGDCGYRWGYPPNGSTDCTVAQTNYHQYPCSKCHTPHAARLPRLMVTNCLDVGTGTTTARHSGYTYPQTDTSTKLGLPGTQKPWDYSVTCHADHAGAKSPAGGGGWNAVTPW